MYPTQLDARAAETALADGQAMAVEESDVRFKVRRT